MVKNQYAAPQRPYPQALPRPPIPTTTLSGVVNQMHPSRPRPKSRSFSFRSDRSSNKGTHEQLHETSEEKEAKRLHSKADPTLAMNEAEPSAVAAGVKSSLAPLRSIQHKDAFGNPIADPDKSNPTRSRWERPLDTIRSFEAAIDGAYNVRKSYVRADSDSMMVKPRNYYQPRFPQESYYGLSRRPESALDHTRPRDRDSYLDVQQQGHSSSQHPNNTYQPTSRQRFGRLQSEPIPSNLQNGPKVESSVHPLHNNHSSYETVASGASGISGSAILGIETPGYVTDLTSVSDNSSIHHHDLPAKPWEPVEEFGISFNNQGNQSPAQVLMASGSNKTVIGSPLHHRRQGVNCLVQSAQQYEDFPPFCKDGLNRKPMQIWSPVAKESRESIEKKTWLMRRFSKRS